MGRSWTRACRDAGDPSIDADTAVGAEVEAPVRTALTMSFRMGAGAEGGLRAMIFDRAIIGGVTCTERHAWLVIHVWGRGEDSAHRGREQSLWS